MNNLISKSLGWFCAVFLVLTCNIAWAASTAESASTVQDITGRTVKIKVPVQRVMLGEGRMLYLTSILDTDHPLDRIVGWRKDLMQTDPDTYKEYQEKFPQIEKLPVIGGFNDGSFSIEQALSLKPDVLILNVESKRAAEDGQYIQKLAALNIPVVFVDFRNDPTKNTAPSMRIFGKLFGKEQRAEEFLKFYKDQTKLVTDVIEHINPKRPTVFLERIAGYTDDCCLSFGNENFGRFVEQAGGDNIAKNIIKGTFGQVNPEQIIASSPEYVIVTSANWSAIAPNGQWIGVGPGADLSVEKSKLRNYASRTVYKDTIAAKNNHIYAVWHQFYNSPYQFIAIQQFAKWLHPDLFKSLNPDENFKVLHDRFLPVPYKKGYFLGLAD